MAEQTKKDGDDAQKIVDLIKNTTDSTSESDKAAEDMKIIDQMNSTGRAKCEGEKKAALDQAVLDQTALKTAKDLANSTEIKARASAALGANVPSEANAKQAQTDQDAAIDAAIAAAVANQRLSNSQLSADLYFDKCLTTLDHFINLK